MGKKKKRARSLDQLPHHRGEKKRLHAEGTRRLQERVFTGSSVAENGDGAKPGKAKLPIYAHRKTILETVTTNETVILVGETGSGKTTQLPQYLHKGGVDRRGGGIIAITQPRRVAAISVSKRVAEEMKTTLGIGPVGYAVRFDNTTSSNTRIKYMTDGLLLREALLDPMLVRYSIIILDEAHERTMHTDVLFGIVKGVQRERNKKGGLAANKPLRVVVMSATLQTKMFSKYFNNAPVLKIPGRTFPVDVYYTRDAQSDYIDGAMTSILQIHLGEAMGDVLVFLPGQEDIESLSQLLEERAKRLPPSVDGLVITPIYAALPPEKQMLAFAPTPPGMRKIVLATNIAETSITIDGIRHVVDTGFVKVKGHYSRTGMEFLRTVPISKAQAWQRAGRAGRQHAGKCFRLYREVEFETLSEVGKAEIHRSSLSTLVLQLKALNVEDVATFDFIEPPPAVAIHKAIQNLTMIQALDAKTKALTGLGKRLTELPLEPQFGLLLLKSTEEEYECSEEMLTIISMLSSDTVFFSPVNKRDIAGERHRRFAHELGDHLTYLNVYESYRKESKDIGVRQWLEDNFINGRALQHAVKVRQQLRAQLDSMKLLVAEAGDDEKLCKCLVAGCYLTTAKLSPDKKFYTTMVDRVDVRIHPGSTLFRASVAPAFVVYVELVKTSKNYIRGVTMGEEAWLREVASHCFG
jgi:ATP-dependent RNA helicase DHX8/PRP22